MVEFERKLQFPLLVPLLFSKNGVGVMVELEQKVAVSFVIYFVTSRERRELWRGEGMRNGRVAIQIQGLPTNSLRVCAP